MSDIGGSDEQDEAEGLDDDVVGGGAYPPDEPFGLPELLARDVTAAGEYASDSVEERSVREQSSGPGDEEPDVPFGLVDLAPDGEIDLTAELGEPDDDGVVLSEAVRPRVDDRSPEEAALHIEEGTG
jgi:hypothetical protein